MNQERKPSVIAVENFRKNFTDFIDSISSTFEGLNRIIGDQGISENIKNMARGLYLVKLAYFNLQKEYLITIKDNLIKDEFYEVVTKLSVIDSQIESSIESTLKELQEVNGR